jgi:hypothetical protein
MSSAFNDTWSLHWLTASGGVEEFKQRISSDIDEAFKTLKRFTPPPRLDIVLDRSQHTIPEIGILGHAHTCTLFSLNFDPNNPNFKASLTHGALQRHILHEVHHCMRMAGPGYGWSLGEVLVSEGLAGHFVNHLISTPPEPWEHAINPETLQTKYPTKTELQSSDYNHDNWFFGRGHLPRWLGYTLGFELVRLWRESVNPKTHDQWINTPSSDILAVSQNAGLIRD